MCFRTFDPLLAVSYALVHKRAAALSEAAAVLHAARTFSSLGGQIRHCPLTAAGRVL